jgi:hypothetical protein
MLLVWMKPSLLGRYGNEKGNIVGKLVEHR